MGDIDAYLVGVLVVHDDLFVCDHPRGLFVLNPFVPEFLIEFYQSGNCGETHAK